MAWRLHTHADAATLHAVVADAVHAALALALATQDTAVLSLAGGGTPLPAYRQLAAMNLPWSRVIAVPGDERCVPHDHPACNLRQLRDCFASTDAQVRALTTADGEPEASLVLAKEWLAAHAAPFAATVLGMGADGHTASLFPGAANLAEALDPACRVDAVRVRFDPLPPEAPFERISMTARRLLHADSVLLLLTGTAKRAVLEEALADPARHPVGALLHAPGSTLDIHWSP